MRGKNTKKIRRVANKKIRTDMEGLAKVLSEASLYWRIIYSIRIIFKWHPKIKFIPTKNAYSE